MNKGRLIVFSAPSGCGKGTMLAKITENEKFYCAVSATTRSPRRGETEGVDYYYLTKEEFEQKISEGAFFEYASYCDNYYGTLLSEVTPKLEAGINVILEIEVQGAMRIRELSPDALFIFVMPPSVKELRRRLKKRGTESDEIIEKRVSKALDEIPYAKKYDYIIVNAALEDAVEDFFTIIRTDSLTVKAQGKFIDEVIENA